MPKNGPSIGKGIGREDQKLTGHHSANSPWQDEDMIITSRGGYFDDANLGWELGVFCLTSKRLFFLRDSGLAFEVPLEEISHFEVGRKTSDFYGRKMLRVTIGKNGGREESRVWWSLMNVAGWIGILKRHVPMKGKGVGASG